MYIDDGGRRNAYVHMKTIEDFIIIAIQSAPYFLMKPLPWEADSFLTFLQSFENIFILIFLSFMFVRTSKMDKQIAFKWLIYLFVFHPEKPLLCFLHLSLLQKQTRQDFSYNYWFFRVKLKLS